MYDIITRLGNHFDINRWVLRKDRDGNIKFMVDVGTTNDITHIITIDPKTRKLISCVETSAFLDDVNYYSKPMDRVLRSLLKERLGESNIDTALWGFFNQPESLTYYFVSTKNPRLVEIVEYKDTSHRHQIKFGSVRSEIHFVDYTSRVSTTDSDLCIAKRVKKNPMLTYYINEDYYLTIVGTTNTGLEDAISGLLHTVQQ